MTSRYFAANRNTSKFVTPVEALDGPAETDQPAHLLRSAFDAANEIVAARLYCTALGVYEFEINGQRVGADVLSPGWNSYQDRLRYQTYDVTSLVRTGANAWGARLADGWYRGRLGFNGGKRNIYGQHTALLAQLHLNHADGTEAVHSTGPDWMSLPSEILSTGLLDGETVDARQATPHWSDPDCDASNWKPVGVIHYPLENLTAPDGPPVRVTQLIRPVSITHVGPRTHLLDFGQNLVGRIRFTVDGESGRTITVRHAELLQDGRLCTAPLRHASATDRYTLRGNGPEVFEPRFTTHGFRYAEIEGWPGDLAVPDVEAVVLHTDMEPTTWFHTSDSRLNRLEQNIRWGMRGNFLDVPTDCPQRDERLAYTGDLHMFAPTAAALYDCSGLVLDWLTDLVSDQARSGTGIPPEFSPQIPVKMPFPVPPGNLPAAGWSDAIIGVPWAMYRHFGDPRFLTCTYEGMAAWTKVVEQLAGPQRVWDTGFQFGDWLDPSAPPDNPSASTTENALVATAYYAHSTRTLAQVARTLGITSDADSYDALADEIDAAFRARFVLPGARMTSDTQAAYTLAIRFNLLRTDHDRQAAGDRLAELVRDAGHRIGTGFLATPHVCDALLDTGHAAEAYGLIFADRCPSWLYQVDMGATTIWERWDSLLPDGSLNPGEMTSFNHYAFGSVADFIYRRIGGIDIVEPGHRAVRIAPRPPDQLTHSALTRGTPYGRITLAWTRQDATIRYRITIPVGIDAHLDISGVPAVVLRDGTHEFETSTT